MDKQKAIYLVSLCEWMTDKRQQAMSQILLSAIWVRKLWRAMKLMGLYE